jgi:hypothetical protein
MGISRSGAIQTLYKVIVVYNAENKPVAIVGNASQFKSEPNFIYINVNSLRNFHLIKKVELIPSEIHPSTSLSESYLKETTWETATEVGICLPPILAPIIFGQKPIKGSIYDEDFPKYMSAISVQHCKWAHLI